MRLKHWEARSITTSSPFYDKIVRAVSPEAQNNMSAVQCIFMTLASNNLKERRFVHNVKESHVDVALVSIRYGESKKRWKDGRMC